jgi:replicative DNA helicase
MFSTDATEDEMDHIDPTDPGYTPERETDIRVGIEHALIGAVLLNNRTFRDCIGIIDSSMFLDEMAGDVFGCAAALVQTGQDATALTIRAAFPKSKAATPDGLRLMMRASSSITTQMNVGHYARQIAEFAERKQALEALDMARNRILGAPIAPGETLEAIAEVTGFLNGLAKGEGEMVDAGVIIDRILAALDKPIACNPTGLKRLDYALGGGLYAGKLYGIAARMKHGKTTLLGTVSYNLATAPEPTPHLYLCLEMGATEIMQRMVARHARRNDAIFRTAGMVDVAKSAAIAAAADLRNRGLYFQTEHRMTIDALRALIIRAAMSGRIKGIVLDYLQLVTGQRRGQNVADHWDYVVQSIVEVAKEHGLWVMCAAQLNRDGEVRGGDGLLNACDMTLYLHKVDREYITDANGYSYDGEGKMLSSTVGLCPYDRAYIEMRASRYTPLTHIGSAKNPKMRFVETEGPHIEEL